MRKLSRRERHMVWSVDVIPTYNRKGWAVRRAGSTRVISIHPYQRDAIARALKIRTAYYVFVHRRDGTVRNVIRTRVKRLLEEENWRT